MRNPFKIKPTPAMILLERERLENMTLQTRLEAAEQILLQYSTAYGFNDKWLLEARRWGDRKGL